MRYNCLIILLGWASVTWASQSVVGICQKLAEQQPYVPPDVAEVICAHGCAKHFTEHSAIKTCLDRALTGRAQIKPKQKSASSE